MALTANILSSPIINGTPTGSGVPTMVVKAGTGLANYTTTSLYPTFADVDSTNLSYTVLVPTGWKLHIVAAGDAFVNTAIVQVFVALFDSPVNLQERIILPPNAGSDSIPFSLAWLVDGDNATHTLKLRYATAVAADAAGIRNSSSSRRPTMVFTLAPSN